MLEKFFLTRHVHQSLFLTGEYQVWLVVLSICVACLSSIMALHLSGLARDAKSRGLKQTALLTGSFSLGVGIWSMHFIGMLAFDLCSTVQFDLVTTFISMLPAVFSSWVALNVLSHKRFSVKSLIFSGVLVGAGIGIMHYTGMSAMVMSPELYYDPFWFWGSIVVAVLLSILALWIRFGLSQQTRLSPIQSLILSGMVMGCAISGMHYTGMEAARFVGYPQLRYWDTVNDHTYLALAISLITVTMCVFVLAGNTFLSYRQLFRKSQLSEARLRAIVDTAVDGIITIDQHGKILAVNQSVETLFGWTAEELIGQSISILMPEPSNLGHEGYLAQYLAIDDERGRGVGREVTAKRKDGSIFPIRLAVGKAETTDEPMFVGFVSDISVRKQMERELENRETQYRTLISNMPGIAFRSKADAEWTKLFLSDAFTTLTGWDKTLFLTGRLSTISIIHPDDLPRLKAAVNEAIANKWSYDVEYRIMHRNGGEIWVSQSAGIVYDENDEPLWIDGVIIDITESKLRAAEYEGIVYAIRRALAVVELDMQGHILDANENFLSLMGYQLEELRGQHHSILCLPEEVASDGYQAFWRSLNAGEFQSSEFCRVAKDGRLVWIQAAYNPILDADGKPWKVFKLAIDLSLRKAIEHDLIGARDRAEQASASKGMFLANVSHEIRTPMNAIIGFTELLLNSSLDNQQRRHLQTVRQSARSLLGLLNDVLDTAKLERGAVELDCDDFSFYELCEQLVGTFVLQADSKKLQLHLDYADDCPPDLYADGLRLRQILTNLIGNAVKFTEQGQVTLKVYCQGPTLCIDVADTGIGIAPERLDSIFAPFTQADASMARRFGGTGLGTTISRQLVELMGGKITVSSRLGEGSCFMVRLPLNTAKQPVVKQSSEIPELPLLRILAVDDVRANLELLQLSLQREGHEVVIAQSGESAVQMYMGGAFDMVLMDVQMPDVDGLEATRRIRRFEQEHQRHNTPVIALTASVLVKDREDAREAGMNGFASKPLDMDELQLEMARMLGLEKSASSMIDIDPASIAAVVIDWSKAIARWGSKEKLQNMIWQYLSETRAFLPEFVEQHDDVLKASAHRLRGVAANLGLLQVAGLCKEVELGTLNASNALDMLLATALAAVENEVGPQPKTESAEQSEGAGHAVEPSVVLPLLERLYAAYSQSCFDDQTLGLLQQALPGRTNILVMLQQALDGFDFDAARAELLQIKQVCLPEADQSETIG